MICQIPRHFEVLLSRLLSLCDAGMAELVVTLDGNVRQR